jgi:methyl-accepting chemotaxis protein
MKLQTRLGLSTSVLIAVMLVGGFTASRRILAANRVAGGFVDRQMPLLLNHSDFRFHSSASIRALQAKVLLGGAPVEGAREDRAEEISAARRSMEALEEVTPEADAQGAERIRHLRELVEQLNGLEEQTQMTATKAGPESAALARQMLQTQVIPLSERILDASTTVSENEAANVRAAMETMRQTNLRTVWVIWLAMGLTGIGGSVGTVLMARSLLNTLHLVANRANAIADGDLTGEELQVGENDQIGQLADAMNRMQTALGAIIGTVADTAGSLTGSAVSMGSASDQIHRRIDQQAQQTQQAATAMQEMSASIAEVSRHTQSAAETARAAAQTAREGGLIVKQMLGSMHSIAGAVTETSTTVGLLGEDSKRISQIVTVIDEIARKTNLLALNAAIEAARAGEQGRGFAVVAGEVRRLAESTGQATGEIAAMIKEIQDRTRSAIAGMASGTGTVQEGVVTTTKAGEALERIIGMAERVDRMIAQIAIAASQQASAADQSSLSLDSIHSLSHENLSEMATTAAGIENLRGTAVRLERQVDRFQVTQLKAVQGG